MPIGRNGFARAKGTNIDKLLTTIKEEVGSLASNGLPQRGMSQVKNNKECQNDPAKKNTTIRKYIKF
jgi:hypothetical protein